MKYIKELAIQIFKKDFYKSLGIWQIGFSDKTPLGRWNVDYCRKIINTKVELSNEDHCGTCSQYASKIKKDVS